MSILEGPIAKNKVLLELSSFIPETSAYYFFISLDIYQGIVQVLFVCNV